MRPPTLALPHKGGGNQKAFRSKTLSLILPVGKPDLVPSPLEGEG
jgi:hypothetical protein